MAKRNLVLPGNPRYQPVSLVPYFGYDNLVHSWIWVESALLKALADIGYLPDDAEAALRLRGRAGWQTHLESCITTTKVDYREKTAKRRTKHDIRALVLLMQENLPPELRRWVHFGATSFDIRDTAAIIDFKAAYHKVTAPTVRKLALAIAAKTEEFAGKIQIGRTHGQHALPITVGFWLATILNRLMTAGRNLEFDSLSLVGKFSGAVGAHNAQIGLGIEKKYQEWRSGKSLPDTFEAFVLAKLGLKPAAVSTQILPPEPLSRFLYSYFQLSAVLAQLGNDGRNLQRTEIAEVMEVFEKGQTGSSTMAHKRNPITFENTAGIFKIVKAEFLKVMDCMTSDHQRDLVDSSVMREFPGIVVLVQYQLESLLRLIPKMVVDPEALKRNFQLSANVILAEPIYLALILGGYRGDAHKFVNHTLTPRAKESGNQIIVELEKMARRSQTLQKVLENIPKDVLRLLHDPREYVGSASAEALRIASGAHTQFSEH